MTAVPGTGFVRRCFFKKYDKKQGGTDMAQQTVFVNEFTNGILGPEVPMLGPVRDGGYIVANTAAGCWGPMLTPAIRGGH